MAATRIRRWAIRGALAIAALVAALAVGGAFLLRTDAGRAVLAGAIADAASVPGEQEIAIGRLDGALPGEILLSEVTVADRDGVWLTLGSARMSWRPWALLRARLTIDMLAVDGLTLTRPPAESPDRDDDTPLPREIALPSLPVDIRLSALDLDNVVLGEALLGERVSLRATGRFGADTDGDARARLRIERTDGAPLQAALDATLEAASQILDIDLSVAEPAGGLIARLAGLPDLPAVSLALKGRGPAADWRGLLAVEAAGLATLNADVAIGLGERRTLGLSGGADISGLAEAGTVDPGLLALAGAVPQFDIMILQAADGTVAVERAHLTGAAAELRLTGTLDPETLAADLEMGLEVTNPETAAQMTGGARFSTARATATVRGPPDRLTVGVRSEIGGFSGFGLTAAHIESRLDADLHRHGGTGNISVGISGIAADSPGAIAGLPPELDLSTSFAADLEEQAAAFSDLRLVGAGMAVTGNGRADLDGGDVALDLRATMDSLAPVAAIAGIDLSGRADAALTLSGTGLGERMSGTLSVELADLASDGLPLAPTVGRTARLTATVAAASPDGVEISAFRLAGANLAVDGRLAIGGAGETIDLAATIGEHRLAPWGALTGVALAGSVSGAVSVGGALDDPRARLDIDLKAVGTEDGAAGPFDGRIAADASMLASAPTGRISANLTGPAGPVAAAARFALHSADTLAFDAIRLTAAGVRAEGTVSLGLENGLAAGKLAIAADDLDAVAALAGVPVSGSLTADLSLGSAGDDQTATLRLAAPSLTLTQPGGNDLAARGVAVTARLDGLSPDPKFSIGATFDRVAMGDMAFTELSLKASGTPDRIAFEAEAAGTLPAPADLAIAGSAGEIDGGWTITLDRMTGSAAEYPFRLREPVTATLAAERLSVSPLDLSLGDGRLTGDASLDAQRVAVRLDLAGLPLALVAALGDGAPPLGGTLSVQAKLDGDPAAPEGSIDLQLADVTAREVAPASNVALHGEATALLGDGRLALRADIGGFSERGLTLDATLPLQLSVQPFAASLPPDGAVEARMDWQGQVSTLWEALPLAGHRLAGIADISLRAGGTVADPLVTARLSLADGRYENLDIGTVLDRLALSATVDEGRTLIVDLSGTDGGSGTLSGAGTVELDPRAGFPMTVDIRFGNATLVRRDDITLSANGDLDISGDMTAMTLSGEIETTRIEARVDESLPPSVVDLDVVDSQTAEDAQTAGREETAESSPLTLDLALIVPRQAFVRGRGLDSEWAGRLEVTGNAASPAIAGTLSFVRGDFNFAGKRFSLEGSTIAFDGTSEVDPLLNIRAAHRTGDVTALILIGGRASNPTIELSASPPLPQDEILARVLFGKGAGSLSAVEAVQLAAAVGQLSGQAGGIGLFDRMRNALGVDVLEVGATEEGGANLRAGRYINESTFVGVTQGTAPGSTGVIVEIEILPNITVDSEVDPTGTNKTGIKWKYDY